MWNRPNSGALAVRRPIRHDNIEGNGTAPGHKRT
jgi:hypothetical protein